MYYIIIISLTYNYPYQYKDNKESKGVGVTPPGTFLGVCLGKFMQTRNLKKEY